MKEYIEREAAIAEVEEWRDMYPDSDAAREALSMAKRAIRKLPAADARPVVLCRDCKHNKGARVWRFLDLDDTTADCSAGHGYPPMDWFCADGEKREES